MDFLDRPGRQRALEYRYRFGQALVFGIPVWGLELFGHSLGGLESARWVGILQALLTGWIVYVGATGMLFEGLILVFRRRLIPDLPVAVAAVGLFAWSVARLAVAPLFHWCALLLAVWAGARWWWCAFAGGRLK